MNNNTAGYIALRSVLLALSACAILGLLLSSRVGFIAASMVMVIIVLVCAATLALVYYPSRIIRVSTLFVAMLFTRFLVSDIAELAAKWGDTVDWSTQVYILGQILFMCIHPVMFALGKFDDKSKSKSKG